MTATRRTRRRMKYWLVYDRDGKLTGAYLLFLTATAKRQAGGSMRFGYKPPGMKGR